MMKLNDLGDKQSIGKKIKINKRTLSMEINDGSFMTQKEEIEYLKAQLQKEREDSAKREESLREQLEFALRSSEKISQECNRSIEIAERLRSYIEGDPNINFLEIKKDLNSEISKMTQDHQKVNHLNQKYRNDLIESQNKLNQLRLEIASLFEEQLAAAKNFPQFAHPLINISTKIDTSDIYSIINAIRQTNQVLFTALSQK